MTWENWPTPAPFQTAGDYATHGSLFSGVTHHDKFARCVHCTHATVGLDRPYAINHRGGCPIGEWARVLRGFGVLDHGLRHPWLVRVVPTATYTSPR